MSKNPGAVVLEIFVISVHPEFIAAYSRFGVLRAAQDKGLAAVTAVALRDFAVDKHGSVDDHPYGGGDGMVLRPEPLARALTSLKWAQPSAARPLVILTSPGGTLWTQEEATWLAAAKAPLGLGSEVGAAARHLVFICGRFAGVDQRFIDLHVDREYSCGDVVLAGGELPALMMIDSVLRLIPGVLGHADSARFDSFAEGFAGGLEHPLYTRPQEYAGQQVPPVLLSGDHQKIAQWRQAQALARTLKLRPDLLAKKTATKP